MNLAIKLEGLDAIAGAFDKAPDIVEDELAQFAEGAALFMQGEIQERTPTATGNLRESFIAGDVERLDGNVIASVGTSLSHAVPVELGTRPHFPPVQAIADWVKVKFGIGGKEGERIAYAIARKISEKGTQGAHMVAQAFDAGRSEVERQFGLSIENIKARIVASQGAA